MFHLLNGLHMALGIHPGQAVFENRYLETVLEDVLCGISHAELRSNAAYKDLFNFHKAQHLSHRLAGFIEALVAAVLLLGRVFTLVKDKAFVIGIRIQILVNLSAVGALHAMRRPWTALGGK